MRRPIILTASLLLVALIAPLAFGQLIDFELTPSGAAPVDDGTLFTPYDIAGPGTVRFFFDTNGNNSFDPGTDGLPVFEAAGPDVLDGFVNSTLGLNDTAMPGYAAQLGGFFLRPVQPGSVPAPFIIDYDTPLVISALSGEIWDIDGGSGTEKWQVDVLDAANNVLVTQFSPLGVGPALDGLPWTFAFSGLPAGVDKVRLTFIGTKTSGVGLAFNNFQPYTAPEPSTFVLLGVGLPLLAVAAWKRRRR
jgi:PEP-CTERM motif